MNPDIHDNSNQPPQWTPPEAAPAAPEVPAQPSPKQPRWNRRRLIIAVVAVLVVAGVITGVSYFLSQAGQKYADQSQLNNDNATDFDNSNYATETSIPIVNGAFASTNLLIAPHTRVNIQNQDSQSHYITTTNPNQTDGPAASSENDPRLPLGNEIFASGGYSHVFEKPGTYLFHLTDTPTNLTVVVK